MQWVQRNDSSPRDKVECATVTANYDNEYASKRNVFLLLYLLNYFFIVICVI